ncbi:MAG: hypothetical protein P4M00_04515 [Azospirillaceae bacterium]|nr:hypothetical protein [Azospirillaceae bacterium]
MRRRAWAPLRGSDSREIQELARDMREGRWLPTGEALVFDECGCLLNGRKRLRACEIAGRPFVTYCVWGVRAKVLDTINTQQSRDLGDALRIRGHEDRDQRTLSTVLQLLWRLRSGTFDGGPMASDMELLGLLDAHPGILESLVFAGAKIRIPRLGPFAAMHFLLSQVNQKTADAFFAALCQDAAGVRGQVTGTQRARLSEDHPAFMVNSRILRSRALGERMVPIETSATIVLGWNHFVTGRLPKSYTWQRGEAFPAIEEWRDSNRLVDDADLPASTPAGAREPLEQAAALQVTKPMVIAGAARPAGGATALCVPGSPNFGADEAAVWHAAFPDAVVPVAVLMMIDREVAQALRARNENNRNLRVVAKERYRRDILAGDFESLNGETIKIAKDGRLLDGQHRVEAIIEADRRLPFLVMQGLDANVFQVLDRGRRRAFSEIAAAEGVSSAVTVASAVRMLWFLQQWERDQTAVRRLKDYQPSNRELAETFAAHPEIATATRLNYALRPLLAPSAATVLEYLIVRDDAAKGSEFLKKLSLGDELAANNPILVVRNLLFELQLEKDRAPRTARKTAKDSPLLRAEARYPLEYRQLGLALRAYGFWKAGKTATKRSLRWLGTASERFPTLEDEEPMLPLGSEEAAETVLV